MSTGAKADASL